MSWLVVAALACDADKDDVPVFDEVGADTDAEAETDIAPTPVAPDTGADVDTDPPDDSAVPAVDTADTDAVTIAADTGYTEHIEILLSADDAWELYIDGVPYTAPNQQAWSVSDRIVVDVPGDRHVIAVRAWDVASVISGFIGVVWSSVELYSVTGDGKWKVTDTPPDPTWTLRRYDDSAWVTATPCAPAEAQVWGTYWLADMYASGAQFVWTGSCRGLGQRWFRLVVE